MRSRCLKGCTAIVPMKKRFRFIWILNNLSENDIWFHEILDVGKNKNKSHYKVPLSFKQKNIKISNNRRQTLENIPQLKGWFEKDLKWIIAEEG